MPDITELDHDVAHDVDYVSDQELTRLALACDPDAGVSVDAVSIWEVLGDGTDNNSDALLPGWYMPPPVGRRFERRRWKRVVVIVVIVAFIVVNAYGLCSTYGSITIA